MGQGESGLCFDTSYSRQWRTFQRVLRPSGTGEASEWILREINNDLAKHMFPKTKYNWSIPKQFCLCSDELGLDDGYILYAEHLSPRMLVTVNKRESCNLYNSRVAVWVNHFWCRTYYHVLSGKSWKSSSATSRMAVHNSTRNTPFGRLIIKHYAFIAMDRYGHFFFL